MKPSEQIEQMCPEASEPYGDGRIVHYDRMVPGILRYLDELAEESPPLPTLRDRFATAAMQALVTATTKTEHGPCISKAWEFPADVVAKHAYILADAMLGEREKKVE